MNILKLRKNVSGHSLSTKLRVSIVLPTLKTADGKLITNTKEKADVLNQHFQSVFTRDTDVPVPNFPSRTNSIFSLNDIILTKVGIVKLINDLNSNKSPGPDEISAKFLKLAPDLFAEYLFVIYQKCLKFENFPNTWKEANVTPIFKKGSKSSSVNYRPISLTS